MLSTRVVASLKTKHPHAAAHLDEARDDLPAFTAFPRQIWRQIRSNNPQERQNKQIRRRTDVVAIFPDNTAITRLAGAVLMEQTDESTQHPPLHRTGTPRQSPPAARERRNTRPEPGPTSNHRLTRTNRITQRPRYTTPLDMTARSAAGAKEIPGGLVILEDEPQRPARAFSMAATKIFSG